MVAIEMICIFSILRLISHAKSVGPLIIFSGDQVGSSFSEGELIANGLTSFIYSFTQYFFYWATQKDKEEIVRLDVPCKLN